MALPVSPWYSSNWYHSDTCPVRNPRWKAAQPPSPHSGSEVQRRSPGWQMLHALSLSPGNGQSLRRGPLPGHGPLWSWWVPTLPGSPQNLYGSQTAWVEFRLQLPGPQATPRTCPWGPEARPAVSAQPN